MTRSVGFSGVLQTGVRNWIEDYHFALPARRGLALGNDKMGEVRTKRWYDPVEAGDGTRIAGLLGTKQQALVERHPALRHPHRDAGAGQGGRDRADAGPEDHDTC